MAPSPEWMDYLRAMMALVFVACLIVASAYLAKRSGLDRRFTGNKKGPARLKIVETLYLDPRHRIVIIRHDDAEHLLLLGTTADVVVASSKKSESDVA